MNENRKMPSDFRTLNCQECRNGAGLDFEFTMAFQPIVNIITGEIYSHEALVRGKNNEGAYEILSRVNDSNRYSFDQACRVKAIELASRLGLKSKLNINFLPNAVYSPETCIRTTLEASKEYNFDIKNIVFEITEGEKIEDHNHLLNIINSYKKQGFLTAIDDFGAGYSGLNLLAKFQPDIIKLDMALIRKIDQNKVSKTIVRGIVKVCNELSITVIAEGIETREEFTTVKEIGINLHQGYYFARPSFESLGTLNPALFHN